jgi:hypothetical protein
MKTPVHAIQLPGARGTSMGLTARNSLPTAKALYQAADNERRMGRDFKPGMKDISYPKK